MTLPGAPEGGGISVLADPVFNARYHNVQSRRAATTYRRRAIKTKIMPRVNSDQLIR
jgi:hypothetical protein